MKNAVLAILLTWFSVGAYSQVSNENSPSAKPNQCADTKPQPPAVWCPIPYPSETQQKPKDSADLKVQRAALKVAVDSLNGVDKAAYWAYESWKSTEKGAIAAEGAAKAAKIATAIASLMAVIAGIQVWMFGRQLAAMGFSMRQTTEAFYAAHRPKLVLRDVMAAIDWDEPIRVSFTVFNVGGSKATIKSSRYAVALRAKTGFKVFLTKIDAEDAIAGKKIEAGSYLIESHTSPTLKWETQSTMQGETKIGDLFKADEELVFSGNIKYSDANNITREISFYRRYDRGSERFYRDDESEIDQLDYAD